MRNLFFLLLLFSVSSFAQEGINYQGVATNSSGAELINQNISVQTSIISDSANGTMQWQETHNTTTDQFGLFNLVIGQGASTGSGQSSSFEEIRWGSGKSLSQIEMDATGGSNYSLISTSQMMSVPYALYAKNTNINYDTIANLLINSYGVGNNTSAITTSEDICIQVDKVINISLSDPNLNDVSYIEAIETDTLSNIFIAIDYGSLSQSSILKSMTLI